MADKNFNLEIVTPRKVVFSGEVKSFSAPGVVGGF
jgi:F0F1-type ATP synthase epsilon subunit